MLLLDINMPGMDGIATAEQLSATVPLSAIIMMSVQGEPDYLRRAMLAGAREFLVKPFSADELSAAIRQVHQRERQKIGHMATHAGVDLNRRHAGARHRTSDAGKVVTFFSPKGGVGRTTLAVNFAVAAATELHKRVAVVDGSLQFGDVGVLLNLSPKNNSHRRRGARAGRRRRRRLHRQPVVDHSTGVRVLLAPPSPEMAELVTPDHVSAIVSALRTTHDLVVVDAWPLLKDATLTFLDQSDLVVARADARDQQHQEHAPVPRAGVDQLGYSDDKVKLVLNRADSAYGIRVQDVEQSIGRKIDHSIVSDGRTVVYALNRGVPFVSRQQARTGQPGRAQADQVDRRRTSRRRDG